MVVPAYKIDLILNSLSDMEGRIRHTSDLSEVNVLYLRDLLHNAQMVITQLQQEILDKYGISKELQQEILEEYGIPKEEL